MINFGIGLMVIGEILCLMTVLIAHGFIAFLATLATLTFIDGFVIVIASKD